MIVVAAIVFTTAWVMWVAVATTISVFVFMHMVATTAFFTTATLAWCMAMTTAIAFAAALVRMVMVAAIFFSTASCMVVRMLSSVCVGMFVVMGSHEKFSLVKIFKK